jgi:hypothetical protein
MIWNGRVPSPSRKARDGEASTKPERIYGAGFVEAARFLGGQILAFLRVDN